MDDGDAAYEDEVDLDDAEPSPEAQESSQAMIYRDTVMWMAYWPIQAMLSLCDSIISPSMYPSGMSVARLATVVLLWHPSVRGSELLYGWILRPWASRQGGVDGVINKSVGGVRGWLQRLTGGSGAASAGDSSAAPASGSRPSRRPTARGGPSRRDEEEWERV
jgi:hypothetical protein